MREIKFRAWDENSNGFFGWIKTCVNFFFGFNSKGLVFEKYIEKGMWKNIPLQQYTGLKDKNGVEIYEGDIVKNHRGEYQNLFVQWDYNSYGLFDRIDGLEVREDTLSDEFEVIGNIYQNPELLK